MPRLFRTNKAAIAVEPVVKAAAGSASQAGVTNFFSYYPDNLRQRAMENATISRARDLVVSLISGLNFEQYSLQWMGDDYEEIDIPVESWMQNPDPNNTRQFVLAWTVDDLIFEGRAFWLVTSRSSATGLPMSFQWLPASMIETEDQAGPLWYGPSKQIMFNGYELKAADVVQFISPIQSLLSAGRREIEISNRLDNAAMRFASNEITAGYLQQTAGSEPLSTEDLADLAAAWRAARSRNAVAALNSAVEWKEFSSDPSKLQLVEAREHTMRSLANLANVPGYLVGAPTGTGMTYQNAVESRKALYYYGAKPYVDCISQRLSMNDVLPVGRFCRLDVEDLVESESDESPVEENEGMRLAEVVQKVYLGVGKVITADEAREIVNKAGGDLSIPNTAVPFPMPGQQTGSVE